MTSGEFTEFLIDEIESGNAAFVTNLLTAARAKISAGGGQIAPLVGAALNGKNFNRQIEMNCAVVAKCCRDAIKATADDQTNGPVSGTRLDFSELHG